ncbi:2-haloacid dehalogenase [Meinhardsimonia xiamenensis]|jgi:2-haloacid dehalogenase|uniref:2-haloacid dehalogenase n=1 Tax=Meinhardsimonia xiamenensis TaxID=990712 RepID=A0A1G9GPZ0_9RHOB|nr:haloacid dehalogenase type II [Meinhardsimonia xiamenensis]PRX30513.1 2-haloacid dehalogenase [Meinhardsimonia xiamenensis]SDL02662.1 2-haloacid dehalogenase [Meinhardsimonia xiamenensis]
MGKIEALFFDVFGTVVDWRSSVARALEAALGPRGVSADWAAMADAWRARYQPAMEEVRAGRRPFVVLDVLHRENLEAVLAEFGVGGLSAAELDALTRAWHRLDPWPDSAGGLAALRRARIVAAMSNGNIALMVNLSRHGGLVWDAILGAELAQAYKPDPLCYLRGVEALGLQPAQCMMVAAHNDDLRAARALGLATAFVRRPTEHGPRQTTDLEPAAAWDVVCDSLTELADRLS